MVYSPGFGHHHHHVGAYGFVVEDHYDDCDGNDDVDDDLDVTLVHKDTKRSMGFVVFVKNTGKIYLNFLNDSLIFFVRIKILFVHTIIYIKLISIYLH